MKRSFTKYPGGYVKASRYGDDSKTKYYIYVGDERYDDSGYDDFEDALADAMALIDSGTVSGFIEIEEDVWYEYISYNNYEPADVQKTVWVRHT